MRMVRLLLMTVVPMLLAVSCRTGDTVVIERTVSDSVFGREVSIDTVILTDSVVIRERHRGDTVWIERDQIHRGLRVKVVKDTIHEIRVDTVSLPVKAVDTLISHEDSASTTSGIVRGFVAGVIAMLIIMGLYKILKR